MIVGLLLGAVVVALVVFALRKVGTPGGEQAAEGRAVRRFFEYLLLFGLLVVVATGVSGLLGQLLDGDLGAAVDEAVLARNLAFTVVGAPLLAGVALWSRRRFTENVDEPRSGAWATYVTAASLTSLVVAMTGLASVLGWALGTEDFSGRGLARFLVWAAVWAAHWRVDARLTPRENARAHHLAGSLIGLVTVATGLAAVIAAALRSLIEVDGDLLVVGDNPLLGGLVQLLVGVPVWLVYWISTASKRGRDPLWLGYVLLAGVGGGLVTAITSASFLLHSLLVWLVGDPGSARAAEHFQGAPVSAALAVVGGHVWWYHRAVLEEVDTSARTEVRRIYEYLMAGIGLGAAAVGAATAVVALVDALVDALDDGGPTDDGATNTLLAAATLLAVGGPVWWLHWRRPQAALRVAPAAELASPTRRIYLFILFGIGGVASVVALITGVYVLFQDVVAGTVGLDTLGRMRFSLGVLVAAASISAYHGVVFRRDREQRPAVAAEQWPRFVMLVGAADPGIARELAHRTRAHVEVWARADISVAPWSSDEIVRALAGTEAREVVVLAQADGLQVIPVQRA